MGGGVNEHCPGDAGKFSALRPVLKRQLGVHTAWKFWQAGGVWTSSPARSGSFRARRLLGTRPARPSDLSKLSRFTSDTPQIDGHLADTSHRIAEFAKTQTSCT